MKLPGPWLVRANPESLLTPCLRRCFLALLGLLLPLPCPGSDGATSRRDLADLSIEELLNEKISVAAKKETKLLRTPAAVSVLNQDEIRRLGITSLPEALRHVAGLNVGRINAHSWAISARGFQGLFADKLLVMIDGRTVYQFLFPGVFWEDHDLMLGDVQRIEVIRGPGATLWGANAVNGVINVVTKSAADTQGALVSVAVGSEDRPTTSLRYGGKVGSRGHYRVFAKYFDRDGLLDAEGKDAPYDWKGLRSGFRLDWDATPADSITVQGDLFAIDARETRNRSQLTPPFSTTVTRVAEYSGGSLLGRWNRDYSATSQLSVQASLSHVDHPLGFDLARHGFADLELQHRFAPLAGHDVVWGLGYRVREGDFTTSRNPGQRKLTRHLYTSFVQDEVTLVADRLQLFVGSKFEHHDYTGFELQPSLRLLWTPDERQTVWSSISRAVRTPDPFERHAQLDIAVVPAGRMPMQLRLLGQSTVVSETLIAYELGYRSEPARNLSLDVATFYNEYDHVVEFVAGRPFVETSPAPTHLVLPLEARNHPGGSSYGAEIAAQWQVNERWRLSADYNWLNFDFPEGSTEYDHPENQARLRSQLGLSERWELNGAALYTDRLAVQDIDAHLRLDLGLLWRPTDELEIGLWGQNLLDSRHAEFNNLTNSFRSEVPRGWVLRFTWSR